MRKKVLATAVTCVSAAGLALTAPALSVAATSDGGSNHGWTARSYMRHGVNVSELSNGKVVARVYGGRAELVPPRVGATEATLEVRVPGVSGRTPSVYDQSVASGMAPAEACAFARGMDPYGCGSAPGAEAGRAAALTDTAVAAAVRTLAPASNSSDDFLGSICYDLVTYAGDGSKHAHGCNSRYHDAWTTNYRWIANKMKVTGWTENPGWFHDRINGVGIQARYDASDSYATDWDPYTTETVGSCHDVTTSATGKSGVSYSTTTTVCPERLNPWHSPEFQYFGAKWTGDAAPADEQRGAVASSVHRIPRSQGYAASTYLWISWN